MAPIDILFLFGFLGIWIPQAFWAWLSYQAWKYSKQQKRVTKPSNTREMARFECLDPCL